MGFLGVIEKSASIKVEITFGVHPSQVEEASGDAGGELGGLSWKVHLPVMVIQEPVPSSG